MNIELKIMSIIRLPKLRVIYLCIWDLKIIECFVVGFFFCKKKILLTLLLIMVLPDACSARFNRIFYLTFTFTC